MCHAKLHAITLIYRDMRVGKSFLVYHLKNLFEKFYVYECFVSMYVCTLHMCLVPKEARSGCLFTWNWSHHMSAGNQTPPAAQQVPSAAEPSVQPC